MEIVFFTYGLAFFVLGIAIIFCPRKDSAFKLADNLVYVAAFGLLHGINEWLDLFIIIQVPANPFPLELARMFTLPASFLCLAYFGASVICRARKRAWMAKVITLVLMLIWVVIFAGTGWDFHYGDIWARYVLCIPGTFLVAIALFAQLPQLERTGQVGIVRNAKSAMAVFLFYGLLAGMIVRKADFFPASVLNYATVQNVLGFPVQILRAVCALVVAYNFVRILQVFRWEQEKAVSESRQRLNTVITRSPIILFVTDKDEKVTFIDGQGLGVLNIDAGDALGKPLSEVLCNCREIKLDIGRAIRGETFISTVYPGDVVLKMHYSPAPEEPGSTAGVIGVGIDITEKAKARAELEKYRAQMARTQQLASLGTIGAGMAQELDEPLHVAKVVLVKSISSLRVMQGGGHVLSRLNAGLQELCKAQDIVDRFCRASNIKPRQKAQVIDIYQTVKRILAVFEENARRAGLRLIAAETDIVPCMFISPRELEQIFFTIIQEVIYSTECEKDCNLVISCSITKGFLHVKFIDNCGGLTSEKLATVFEPFIAESDSHDRGFALAVVKQLIIANGGDIEVENEQGKGTMFHVKLPIEQLYE